MTETEVRNLYVNTAITYLGAVEGGAKPKEIVSLYNSIKPLPGGYALKTSDDWCAAFVSAMAQKCKLTDISFPECGCNRMITLYKKAGRWVENEAYVPKVGDILFYDWQDDGKGDNTGTPDHVCIVEKVENGKIHTIEGNYGNSVARRTLAINGKYIRGYGIPDYASKGKDIKAEQTAKPTTTKKKPIEEIAQEVIDGKIWGNGAERKAKLKAAGYDYDAVQAKVNELLKAPAKKSVDTVAREVIAGKWGVGSERKRKLTQAGYDYNAVQKRVNQILK